MSRVGALAVRAGKLGGFATEFLGDMWAYLRFCGLSPLQDRQKQRFYKLLIECHALEKGLSLRDPRPLFGQPRIDFLMAELDRYDIGRSPLPAEMVLGTLATYAETHRARGVSDPLLARLEDYVSERRARLGVTPNGGLRHFASAYADVAGHAPAAFLASRFASRTFADTALDRDRVRAVVELAQSAPSQCNRQSSHAWFYQSPDTIARLLALQGGASGFAGDIRNLLRHNLRSRSLGRRAAAQPALCRRRPVLDVPRLCALRPRPRQLSAQPRRDECPGTRDPRRRGHPEGPAGDHDDRRGQAASHARRLRRALAAPRDGGDPAFRVASDDARSHHDHPDP
ncbi:nitroreductase family protein [Amaricoccus sp. W119]|uniref:nitroreductase family protein n=1 Tax=Amaricoccus sp. W119 TaxID=3391833 RepID=UPI0039A4B2F7